jgi:hypothetical protein
MGSDPPDSGDGVNELHGYLGAVCSLTPSSAAFGQDSILKTRRDTHGCALTDY